MSFKNLKKRIITSIALFILYLLIFKSNLILVYSLIILAVLSILEFLSLSKKILENKISFIISNLFFGTYLFIFCLFFFYFANIMQLKIMLFTLLLSCIASDVGGFIFGNIFKGPKLTKISPKKTISGAFGSIIFSNIFFSISFFFFIGYIDYNIFFIATINSIFCQLGDLLFSYFKRKAKIKDTGNFLPGHGGILDRLDGILIGLPSGFIFLILLF